VIVVAGVAVGAACQGTHDTSPTSPGPSCQSVTTGGSPSSGHRDAGEVKVRVSRLAEANQHDAMSVTMEPCPASDLTQAEALDINQLARM